MTNMLIYSYWVNTKYGCISVVPVQTGGYHVVIADENMGFYNLPQMAVDDVVGNHLGSNPFDVDLDTLELPEDVADWQRKPVAYLKG